MITASIIVTGSLGIAAVFGTGLYLLLRTGETIVPGGQVVEHHGAGSDRQQRENRILLRAHAIDAAVAAAGSPRVATVVERWPEEGALGRRWRAQFSAYIDDTNRGFDALIASLAVPPGTVIDDEPNGSNANTHAENGPVPDFVDGDRSLVDTLAQTSPADVLAWARSTRPVTSLYRTGAYPLVPTDSATSIRLITL